MFAEFADAFQWTCDHCGLEVTFPPDDFHSCVAQLKQRQWRFTRHEREGWLHQLGSA
jgi:hypothetical protein